MKPFRWCYSRIYWARITVDRPSYVSRLLMIGVAVTLLLFVALFYDPEEAHQSHTPPVYADLSLFSVDLPDAAIFATPACLILPLRGEASSGLSTNVLRI